MFEGVRIRVWGLRLRGLVVGCIARVCGEGGWRVCSDGGWRGCVARVCGEGDRFTNARWVLSRHDTVTPPELASHN